MTDILINIGAHEINLAGLVVGASSFFIIMFGRWACIAGEFYFTKKIWIAFLFTGIISLFVSFIFEHVIFSSILSIFGLTLLWGIHEVIEQEERVRKAWFPHNTKREKKV